MKHTDESVPTTLVTATTKVKPLTHQNTTRLELLLATLLARFIKQVKQNFQPISKLMKLRTSKDINCVNCVYCGSCVKDILQNTNLSRNYDIKIISIISNIRNICNLIGRDKDNVDRIVFSVSISHL